MPKLQIQTIAPLAIIAVTLMSLAVLNHNQTDPLPTVPTNISVTSEKSSSPSPINELRLGKPGVQISQVSESTYNMEMNQERDIEIQLETKINSGVLTVHLQSDPGIDLISEQSSWTFELSNNQSVLSLPVSVYANSNGKHYLNIFTQYVAENGNASSKALATAFKVGYSQESSKTLQKQTQVSSQAVISLPNTETIY